MIDSWEIMDTFVTGFSDAKRVERNVYIYDYPGFIAKIEPDYHPDHITGVVVSVNTKVHEVDRCTFRFSQHLTPDPNNKHPNKGNRLYLWRKEGKWEWYIDYPITTEPLARAIYEHINDPT